LMFRVNFWLMMGSPPEENIRPGPLGGRLNYARDLPDDRYKSDLNGSDFLVPMKA